MDFLNRYKDPISGQNAIAHFRDAHTLTNSNTNSLSLIFQKTAGALFCDPKLSCDGRWKIQIIFLILTQDMWKQRICELHNDCSNSWKPRSNGFWERSNK